MKLHQLFLTSLTISFSFLCEINVCKSWWCAYISCSSFWRSTSLSFTASAAWAPMLVVILDAGLLGEMMEGEFVVLACLWLWIIGRCHCHSYCLKQLNNSTQQDKTRVLKNTNKNRYERFATLQTTPHKKQKQSYQLSPPSTWSASSSNLLPLPCWQPPRPRASMQAAKATSHHPPPPNLFAGRSWTKTKMRTGGICPSVHPTAIVMLVSIYLQIIVFFSSSSYCIHSACKLTYDLLLSPRLPLKRFVDSNDALHHRRLLYA